MKDEQDIRPAKKGKGMASPAYPAYHAHESLTYKIGITVKRWKKRIGERVIRLKNWIAAHRDPGETGPAVTDTADGETELPPVNGALNENGTGTPETPREQIPETQADVASAPEEVYVGKHARKKTGE